MKKVLIVHDISCYGKCSTTVALPIISSMELAGVLLPTALLSTHTAGFKNYTCLDLSKEMPKIVEHWHSFNLKFDAIYVGYLGGIDQIHYLKETIPTLLSREGKFYLDPVMADNGEFYPAFNEDYAKEMRALCDMADVIMPNQTEASFIYDLPYQEGIGGLDVVDTLIQEAKSHQQSLILTGAGYDDQGQTGAYYYDNESEEQGLLQDRFVGGRFHGTGDIFGSIVVGVHVNGASLKDATQLAVKTLPEMIEHSQMNENVMMDGLDFEKSLGDLSMFVRQLKQTK
ncbi:MAG: pyridoxamine kinase [Aerococcus sp.]|nr:pyridoxamine kinase [Aerococcus sp.]